MYEVTVNGGYFDIIFMICIALCTSMIRIRISHLDDTEFTNGKNNAFSSFIHEKICDKME